MSNDTALNNTTLKGSSTSWIFWILQVDIQQIITLTNQHSVCVKSKSIGAILQLLALVTVSIPRRQPQQQAWFPPWQTKPFVATRVGQHGVPHTSLAGNPQMM